MVAEWLETDLHIVVPKIGHVREQSLPYSAMLPAPSKVKKTKQDSLFGGNEGVTMKARKPTRQQT